MYYSDNKADLQLYGYLGMLMSSQVVKAFTGTSSFIFHNELLKDMACIK